MNSCIVGWTWSAKSFLYFFPVILSFRVTIGPTENHDTAAHIMTDPIPCSTDGERQSSSYACAGVLQMCSCPFVGKSVKNDSSDINFFHL
ncbi:hypothetical protein TNCV_3063211 [Trichonephila clavipes]|nr:hypothetical protein TNCV_3063211 [Trichonephila clavipes]